MRKAADLEYGDSDPLALQADAFLVIEYGDDEEHKHAANRPLRCSKRQQNEMQKIKVQNTNPAEVMPEPLIPITKRMRERIKRMKQRMLATLKLSTDQLEERRRKRAKQTRESRQRAARGDAAYRRKETDKKIARTKTQREMETAEQMELRMAKKREEGRRYLAKRRQTETPEQMAARQEYQRLYSKNRKPIKFL